MFNPESLNVRVALNNIGSLNKEQAIVIGLIANDGCTIEEVCEELHMDRMSLICKLEQINEAVSVCL
jgi:hypothetical protein